MSEQHPKLESLSKKQLIEKVKTARNSPPSNLQPPGATRSSHHRPGHGVKLPSNQ